MEIKATQMPNGSTVMHIQYTINAIEQVAPHMVIENVTKMIVDKIIELHSADIIAKIDFQTVANLAAIELGKRAVPFV